MKECCNHANKDKSCFRKKDKKTFKLPRKFSIEKCKNNLAHTGKPGDTEPPCISGEKCKAIN
jgi:hypothetical protein